MNALSRLFLQLPALRPFALERPDDYARWREAKLSVCPRTVADLIVEVADPRRLSQAEHDALAERVRVANMAIYAGKTGSDPDKAIPRRLAEAFGLLRLDGNYLADEDGISSVTAAAAGERLAYIPYTNKSISWHTDGYYNPPERKLRSMLLHCVRPAGEGGENRLLDPEILYILLRDRSPEYVSALMHPQAMTIPAGKDAEGGGRDAVSGPVFWIDADGSLYMRYTARKRNICWRDEALTREAVAALEEILEQVPAQVLGIRLEAGMGILCNNVLHDRGAFTDPPGGDGRLLYRARYLDRIACAAAAGFA